MGMLALPYFDDWHTSNRTVDALERMKKSCLCSHDQIHVHDVNGQPSFFLLHVLYSDVNVHG